MPSSPQHTRKPGPGILIHAPINSKDPFKSSLTGLKEFTCPLWPRTIIVEFIKEAGLCQPSSRIIQDVSRGLMWRTENLSSSLSPYDIAGSQSNHFKSEASFPGHYKHFFLEVGNRKCALFYNLLVWFTTFYIFRRRMYELSLSTPGTELFFASNQMRPWIFKTKTTQPKRRKKKVLDIYFPHSQNSEKR